jgi:hypothetical protein
MKTKTYKNRDFSRRIDHLTLKDVIQEQKNANIEKTFIESETLKFESLEENFIPRMLQQEIIKPDRYIWHVAEHRNDTDHELNRYSIATEGLKCEYSACKAVFANNGLIFLQHFYPFVFEFMFDMNRDSPSNQIDITPSHIVLHSDFWRIDTHAFNAKWRIDPNMKVEGIVEDDSRFPTDRNYICTTLDIPPYALRLYKVRIEVYISKLPYNFLTYSSVFPVSILTPDPKVDYWLNRVKRAA